MMILTKRKLQTLKNELYQRESVVPRMMDNDAEYDHHDDNGDVDNKKFADLTRQIVLFQGG